MTTIRQFLRGASVSLSTSDSPALDAELFVAHVLRQDRAWVLTHDDRPLTKSRLRQLHQLVARRRRGWPVATIMGCQAFFRHTFTVRPGVLVPRPESEQLVELAVANAPQDALVVELGVGSGCVIASILAARGDVLGLGTDRSPRALALARLNARQLHVTPRLSLRRADLFGSFASPLEKPWVLVANLPYLPSTDLTSHHLTHEPRLALDGGPKGLDIIQRALRRLARLTPAPRMAWFELDPRNAHAAKAFARQVERRAKTTLRRDASGRNRILELRYS